MNMGKNFEIIFARIIAMFDLLIAITVIGIASFQFAKGASLLGGNKSESHKLTRLVFYASILYIFLMIQVGMSIKLFRGAGQINARPIYAIKVFGWWREWSVVYLMSMLLHAMVVLMLMEESQRRLISLTTTLAHALVRPIGIALIGRFKHNLEIRLPTQILNKDLSQSARV